MSISVHVVDQFEGKRLQFDQSQANAESLWHPLQPAKHSTGVEPLYPWDAQKPPAKYHREQAILCIAQMRIERPWSTLKHNLFRGMFPLLKPVEKVMK